MSSTSPENLSKADSARCAEPSIVENIIDLLEPKAEGTYLDLACETGNYTVALAGKGGKWAAVDNSSRMLGLAKGKSGSIDWKLAEVQSLPFEDETFDGIVCTLGMQYFQNVMEVGKEIGRVLKKDAPLVIFTSTPEQMGNFWLNHYFPMMMADTIIRMPALATVASALNKGGMSIRIRRAYDIQPDHQDGFLYCGKHKPERYMDSKVRDSIPAFRDLVEDYELEDGLERMKADIQSGSLEQIRNSYNRGGGDYMFIKAEKTGVVVEEPEAAPLD